MRGSRRVDLNAMDRNAIVRESRRIYIFMRSERCRQESRENAIEELSKERAKGYLLVVVDAELINNRIVIADSGIVSKRHTASALKLCKAEVSALHAQVPMSGFLDANCIVVLNFACSKPSNEFFARILESNESWKPFHLLLVLLFMCRGVITHTTANQAGS